MGNSHKKSGQAVPRGMYTDFCMSVHGPAGDWDCSVGEPYFLGSPVTPFITGYPFSFDSALIGRPPKNNKRQEGATEEPSFY